MNDLYIYRYFLKDLKKIKTKTKALLSGIITNIQNKHNLTQFTLDDNTGAINCILFRDEKIKTGLELGSMVTVNGESEVDEYFGDGAQKFKVYKYEIFESFNQLLHEYLQIFLQMQQDNEHKSQEMKPENLIVISDEEKSESSVQSDFEANRRKYTNLFPEKGPKNRGSTGASPLRMIDEAPELSNSKVKKIQKRIPLEEGKINVHLRTVIFDCLASCIEQQKGEQNPTISVTEIFIHPKLREFLQKEQINSPDKLIDGAIVDLERRQLIQPVFEHSLTDLEGIKYNIHKNLVENLDEKRKSIQEKIGLTGGLTLEKIVNID